MLIRRPEALLLAASLSLLPLAACQSAPPASAPDTTATTAPATALTPPPATASLTLKGKALFASGPVPGSTVRVIDPLTGQSVPGIVTDGAGNLITGGAGNLITGGAGNLVTGGAGNLVAGGVGSLAAANTGFKTQDRTLLQTEPALVVNDDGSFVLTIPNPNGGAAFKLEISAPDGRKVTSMVVAKRETGNTSVEGLGQDSDGNVVIDSATTALTETALATYMLLDSAGAPPEKIQAVLSDFQTTTTQLATALTPEQRTSLERLTPDQFKTATTQIFAETKVASQLTATTKDAVTVAVSLTKDATGGLNVPPQVLKALESVGFSIKVDNSGQVAIAGNGVDVSFKVAPTIPSASETTMPTVTASSSTGSSSPNPSASSGTTVSTGGGGGGGGSSSSGSSSTQDDDTPTVGSPLYSSAAFHPVVHNPVYYKASTFDGDLGGSVEGLKVKVEQAAGDEDVKTIAVRLNVAQTGAAVKTGGIDPIATGNLVAGATSRMFAVKPNAGATRYDLDLFEGGKLKGADATFLGDWLEQTHALATVQVFAPTSAPDIWLTLKNALPAGTETVAKHTTTMLLPPAVLTLKPETLSSQQDATKGSIYVEITSRQGHTARFAFKVTIE